MTSVEAFADPSTLGGAAFRDILDALPAAVYATDAAGRLTYFNRAAAELAGREPVIGHDEWCVAHRLFRPDGSPLPHAECPMAVSLRERREVRGIPVVAERPNGERVPLMPFPTPLFDAEGRFIGGLNLLVDLSELHHAEGLATRRMNEQAALYRFTDRLYRAETEQEVYDAALDAILSALRCTRASILLFDDSGVMSFVASRGLSDGYRAAVNGHSPWTPETRDPAPIFVDDVMASNESEALKQTIAAEGIGALAFIPLVSRGEVIGKFMTYYEAPHAFGAEEADLALTIARQLGFAIERRRADAGLHENSERLRLAMQVGKVGLWDWDIEADRISWTDSLYSIHGVRKDEFAQNFADWISRVHPDDRPMVESKLEHSLKHDAPYEVEFRALRPDSAPRWIFANAMVLREDGKPKHLVGATLDVTERKEGESQRDLLVAELSHRVKNTLATVVSIARQSFSKSPSLEEARKSFDGRIHALAQTHSRLADTNWSGVGLETLLSDELAPYRREDNVALSGPAVTFNAKSAVVLGMAVHELATNAAKYGALSSKGGRVEVSWDAVGPAGLKVVWRETGGPPVATPERRGFGRILLERAVASDLGGSVDLDFAPAGLVCSINVPLDGHRANP